MNLKQVVVVGQGVQEVVPFESLFKLKDPVINLYLVRRYWNMIVANKKQPQARMVGAGLRRSVKSPGTNKGESRQKYATISGTKRQKSNSPNHRKGRRALYYFKDKTLKMNKKQKRIAIKSLLYLMFIHSDLYLIQGTTPVTTNKFIKHLKTKSKDRLREYLTSPRDRRRVKTGPVILLNNELEGYFRNFPKVLNLKTSTSFFGLYNGFTCRHSFIFEKELLEKVINDHGL